MTIYGYVLPGAVSIALSSILTQSLTERAKHRVKIYDWWRAHGKNASLTARHFGLGRMTLYRWLWRFSRQGITGFNEYSRRPRNLRKPTTPWNTVRLHEALGQLTPQEYLGKLQTSVLPTRNVIVLQT